MKFNLLKNKEKNANLNSIGQEQIREKSTGRSMVEMLGVLAIIGVLSIGGISGYTIAMRRYRANEIATLITKYVALSYTAFKSYSENNNLQLPDTGTPLEAYHNENVGCESGRCGIPKFLNSGLGAYPKGVRGIFIPSVFAPIENDYYENYLLENNLPDSDFIQILVYFTDKELCKTTESLFSGYIAGGSYENDDTGPKCEANYGVGYELIKLIPME